MVLMRAFRPSVKAAPPNPRQSQRVSMCLPADILSLSGDRVGLLVNIGSNGAMVELALPPQVGSEVLLYSGGLSAEGTIVWQRPRHCGIRFHTPLDEAEIDSEAKASRTSFERLLTR